MTQNPSFSQRHGLKPVKNQLQVDSMDGDLRNGLWNVLNLFLWNHLEQYMDTTPYDRARRKGEIFFETLWVHFFNRPMDTLHANWQENLRHLRAEYFKWEWNEVYDFIEFAANHFPGYERDHFKQACNTILERDLSAYRLVDGVLVRITSEAEASAIEEASALPSPFQPVRLHVEAALRLLADRKSPDYRNSIKESISAVESACIIIAGDSNSKVTLGTALKKIEEQHSLHGGLRKAFDSLYGYTSDANGIRHALLEEPDLDFDDAKFMLVSCSAFVNYLISKAAKTKK
jgi:hypothetical protein